MPALSVTTPTALFSIHSRFEKAVEQGIDIRTLRSRIEHAQIMIEDLERIGRLEVIPSIQPAHATDDMWYGEQGLGPNGVRVLYAFRKLINSGARITLGSNITVASILLKVSMLIRYLLGRPAQISRSRKKADYVVLSKDIMKIKPKEILEVEVLATVMDGKGVYVKQDTYTFAYKVWLKKLYIVDDEISRKIWV
ncbi:hypothetical protein K435DRAFT_811449 [Dendrothele bispora CBS 962.96]|uniref:Amidohydrolase 3 domain-containing protein n=1 Tax=Dendrothele bispora (strain CBS 962.96) TaxID=1314807 RepID=A0A4S8KRY1_DENBC|nr:hypothetical protein K435DRAFT_811449 [Dendrothele bispora CBS 962.96]